MNRLERITSILIQLQSKRIVKAQELAERFNISLRTVYRDIRTLEEAGVPISSEAGLGYFLVEGYQMPPVHFTQEEANALILGEKLIEPFSDASVKKQYQSAMYKIRAVLKVIQKDQLELLDEQMRAFHPEQMPANESHFLVTLQNAIVNTQVVYIQYQSAYNNHEYSEREVEPIGLNFYSGHWHLIAWCRKREDYRDFRIDRILLAEPMKQRYKRNSHMGLDEYIQKMSEGMDRFRAVVRVKKNLYPYMANHKHIMGFVKDKELDDDYEVEFVTPSLDFLGRSLLMYMEYITIVDPPELLKKVKGFVEKLSNHYS
ncbi:MAG: YafY family transcriptional regulator [Bacteroidetes bacterium]|nr:YafY family transcriptional regulator [Bacteroidota bacterium]